MLTQPDIEEAALILTPRVGRQVARSSPLTHNRGFLGGLLVRAAPKTASNGNRPGIASLATTSNRYGRIPRGLR
jgi:hypothetical protein